MFLGQYQLNLDEGRHLALPAGFHESLAGGAYITRGFEQNLLIMSEAVFQQIYTRIASLNIADPLARLLFRLILGNASRLEMNAAGQLVLPEALAAAAGLGGEICLVGQGNFCEVWTPENWEKQSADLLDAAANSTRFAQLDLALPRA
jgi:MraZ protein